MSTRRKTAPGATADETNFPSSIAEPQDGQEVLAQPGRAGRRRRSSRRRWSGSSRKGRRSSMAGEVSRRHFMKIMGASTALAGLGLAGCRRPEMHLVPFTKSAEWSIPGKFLFYTTSMPSARGYVPLIVSTYEGRPTKIEGNPYHPINDGHGGTDIYAQASMLNHVRSGPGAVLPGKGAGIGRGDVSRRRWTG